MEKKVARPHSQTRQTHPWRATMTTKLDHVKADEIFKQLALIALGPVIARTISLHSGRVWLATYFTQFTPTPRPFNDIADGNLWNPH